MPRNRDNNRGGNRGGSRGKNNNPEGRNQYSGGLFDMARERPAAAAAVAAGAAAAGVFLWSKRGQISEQLSHISDQIGEWTENMSSERELEMAGETRFSSAAGSEVGGEFSGSGSAIGGTAGTRATAARSARPSANKRRTATSRGSTGSGTMSGGSLDTGPSGRGRE